MRKLLIALALVLVAAPAFGQVTTLDSAVYAVRMKLETPHTDTTRLTDYRVIWFLNEAVTRVSIDCGGYRKFDSVTIAPIQAIYSAPSDAIEGWPFDVVSAYWGVPKHERYQGMVGPWPIDDMADDVRKRVNTHSGYVHDGRYFVSPTPIDTGMMYLFYRAQHPAVMTLADTLRFSSADRWAVIYYAAFLGAGDLQRPDLEKKYWDLYSWHIEHRLADKMLTETPIKAIQQEEQTP